MDVGTTWFGAGGAGALFASLWLWIAYLLSGEMILVVLAIICFAAFAAAGLSGKSGREGPLGRRASER